MESTLNKTIRVMIVDDHSIVREGVRALLSRQRDMEVCGEAESASAALQVAHEVRPDVAIVDISLGTGSGLELIQDLKTRCPSVRILVLSMHAEDLFANRALRAGAGGYVIKQEGNDRLLKSIRAVAAGEVALSDAASQRMLGRIVHGRGAETISPMESLTNRELEVFEFIGQGFTAREIAERLYLSRKTIDRYRENIKHKLNLETASDVLRHATQWVVQAAGAGRASDKNS